MSSEVGRIKTKTTVWKLGNVNEVVYRQLRAGRHVDEITKEYNITAEKKEIEGNVFLIEGVNFLWRIARGDTGLTPFNEANSYIGVGDGTTPASSSQTGLLGTNKYYKKVDSGFPMITDNKITFRATFGGDEANFAWNEWTVANGSSDTAVNLNRKVETLGVKSSGATWVFQVELSIT